MIVKSLIINVIVVATVKANDETRKRKKRNTKQDAQSVFKASHCFSVVYMLQLFSIHDSMKKFCFCLGFHAKYVFKPGIKYFIY